MGIFSNFAINRYRNYVQNNYYIPRLDLVKLEFINTHADDQMDAFIVANSIQKFFTFAVALDKLVFSDTGVFKDDIWKLDADKLNKLYEIFIVYASWEEDNPFMKKAETLNNVFGFEIESTNRLYIGLNGQSTNPELPSPFYGLYRWSTTVIGHEDEFEKSLFDKSPDCKLFEEAVKVAKAHADNLY